MGKHVQKSKSSKDELDEYDNQIDELYRPFLLHSTTYALLTEQILLLMPSERNVLLTMNEYDLCDINPMHPNTADSPTHIIIFCIRFIAGDTFQPIGGLLIYKHKDQSAVLAECLKAYINDLWKLGLHVVGTVSPPFESFKGMLSHLVDVKDFSTYADSIVYSVAPIKEIVHIYDIQFLLIKLQNLFKQGDIQFVEINREFRASWNDISLVLNLSSEFKVISNYIADNTDVSRRVHIFTQQIFEQLLELEAQGMLSPNAGGSAVLLNCVRSFLQFTELDLVDLNIMCQLDTWNNFTNILHSMKFQKSKKRTCTKTKPATVHTMTNPSIRKKIDFTTEEGPEVIKNLSENIPDVFLLDDSEEHCNNTGILEDYRTDQIKSFNNKNKRSDGKNNKHKKSGIKDTKGFIANRINGLEETDSSKLDNTLKIKLHSKKPYDKQNPEKIIISKTDTSIENQKTDFEDTSTKENSDTIKNSVKENKFSKSEDLLENIEQKYDEQIDNKLDCDSDINNCSDHICGNRCTSSKTKSNKINKIKQKDGSFDIVINDPENFFDSFFGGYNTGTFNNALDFTNISDRFPIDPQHTVENHSAGEFIDADENLSNELENINLTDEKLVGSYNDFCSHTDEETENCVSKICDNVPTIVESLGNDQNSENISDDFEQDNVTFEMLCTVFGMKTLMKNLINRRVKAAKPDAFVVEHIDFLVTIIKRDKNKINPVCYFGHNYGFLNSELAFSTLQNNRGLYLVKT